VLTRASADNASLAASLTEDGYRPIELPLTAVAPAADGGAELAAAVERLDRYDLVTLTSVNGVRALADALGGRPWPSGLAVAVVGPTTARAAVEAGLTVDIVPPVATAAALADSIDTAATDGRPRRVLAPLAEAAAETLEAGLRAKGYEVERVEAYRTVAPAALPADVLAQLASAAPAAVTFFAPSAVDRWVDLVEGPTPPLVLCIGTSTAARAAQQGMVGIRTASPHSEAGILALIRAEVDRRR
jgi:uroporphyrinogen-III synthase